MKRYIYTILLLSTLAFPIAAQPVHIPDPNLRAAVRDTLDLPRGAPLTQETMGLLVELDAHDRQIQSITGLEYAINLRNLSLVYNDISDLTPVARLPLKSLWLWDNIVSDLSPIADIRTLTHLDVGYNQIVDLTPLANLTNLTWLEISGNHISDISVLSNLTQLTLLEAWYNKITDVTPLSNLTRLEHLKIHYNLIYDHSPLDGLDLTVFEYDRNELCDMPPLPLQPRLENRTFPSAFTAWGGLGWSYVLNQPQLSDLEQMAQHDLYWCCLMFGGDFVNFGTTVEIRGPLDTMVQVRDDYIAQNPNMIFLVELRVVWDDLHRYSSDSEYWLRDEHGQIEPAWDMGLLNLNNPAYQKLMIDQAVAVSKCGIYDGIFIDGWNEPHFAHVGYLDGAEAILKGIRERVDDNFLIVVNTNTDTAPVSAPHINGLFLESGVPGTWDDPAEAFHTLQNTLSWAENNLRAPQINAPQGHVYRDEPLDSPTNLQWMRAITTLTLTFTDGYALIKTDTWEGRHGHWHYWYDFWDADLGQPVGEKSKLYDDAIPGLYIREFTNGWAVYNHSGVPQVVTLPEKVQAVASGLVNTEHALPNLDGEMYLRIKPKNPADVNGDGVVNIFDLTIVAQAIGTDDRQGDVNGDGLINVFDLVLVANAF